MNQTLWLTTVIFFFSCGSTPTEERIGTIDSAGYINENGFDSNTFESFLRLENYLCTAKIPSPELQVIDSTCAILVNPTDEQFIEMKENYGEDGLATLTDDNGYFQSNARHILDSASIKITEAEKRFIRLAGENNRTWLLDIRKEGAPAWNLIIFNTRKEPEIIPAIDLTHNKIVQYFDVPRN
jgi:hypothetical protein